jgi:hypothetical protein
MKTLWKGRCEGAHRRRNDSQGCNTIEQAGKKVTKEVDRESRRAVESQGGTTITVGAVTPLAIPICPERGPESGPPSLPSLDDLPTLRFMLGLPDRESSPEEVDGDDNNGLERLFWITPGSEPVSPNPASEPPSHCPAPTPTSEPRRSKRTLSIPGHYAVLAWRSPRKPRSGGNV